jgi:hypothetical protein
MFVGDVILSAREAVPDLPGVLAPPGSEITVVPGSAAPSFPAGTYYAVATYVDIWGETSPGPEIQITLGANQSFNVIIGGQTLRFVTAINIYLGNNPGGETWQYNFPGPFTGQPENITFTSTFNVITPPFGNSAFLPDSGGPVASASQVFRWLNDALNRLSGLNGGIPDMSGFGTQQGKANYLMPGDWQTLSDAWYDGYPLFLGSSSLAFRHNTVTALSGMMSYTQVADTLIVELFTQPDRTAGVGLLSVGMNPLSAVAQTSGMTGWVLPFGLAQIGSPANDNSGLGIVANYEIVAYTLSGNNLISLVRGLGGTNAQNWPAGTPVYELNCMFKGLRAPQLYSPGMAANTLRLPSSWIPLMHMYLLARYRRIEQQEDEALKLMQTFEAGAKEATKKKPAVGDRQIQPQDTVAVDVYPLLSREFGGGIIP